jgi:ATP-dependent DNA ligase
MPEKKATASFIEPRLLQRTEKLLEGPDWLIELKLDGYCALAIKSAARSNYGLATTTTSTPGNRAS